MTHFKTPNPPPTTLIGKSRGWGCPKDHGRTSLSSRPTMVWRDATKLTKNQ
jgi:hypothetical protein